jgi:hypothetical protein
VINQGMQDFLFSFTDSQALAGKNYYRARIAKCNGSNVYTGIISLNSKKNLNRFYYSTQKGTFDYAVTEKGRLKVFSSTGQLLWMGDVNPGAGTLPVAFLTQDIYLLQFADEPAVKIIVQQ